MRPLAIYVHVPFCMKKCAYCDFASYAGCEDRIDAYFDALWSEIESAPFADYQIESVFFGGGTPSHVPAERIVQTLRRLRAGAAFAPDAEISIEANPGTLTPGKLRAYRAAGMNRLSIGAQSFDAAELRALGRIHSPGQARDAVLAAREAGFENINIDLMYALPGQSVHAWEETLRKALDLPITHISAYSLIVEPNTEMARRVSAGKAVIPEDEAVNAMQRRCTELLARAGFHRYEISNYAKDGFACRHNLTYWFCGEYFGFGSAAHSLLNNARFSNPPELERYLAGERHVDFTVRSTQDQMEERLMLETRTARGLDLAAWESAFGTKFDTKNAQILEKRGLIELVNGYLRLTETGMELQDAVVLALLEK